MYCINCGKKLNEGDVYCNACGYKNNYHNNFNTSDNNYLLLLLISVVCPTAGIIFYIMYRKKSKKSKNYLIVSLAMIFFRIMIVFLTFCFNLIMFNNFNDNIINSINNIDDYIEENDDADNSKEIVEFDYYLMQYIALAKERFQHDTVSNVCYDIDNLMTSLKYDGSIEISNIDERLVIMIWFTDGKHYVDALNFDDYEINKIQDGNVVNKTCVINNFNNSL